MSYISFEDALEAARVGREALERFRVSPDHEGNPRRIRFRAGAEEIAAKRASLQMSAEAACQVMVETFRENEILVLDA